MANVQHSALTGSSLHETKGVSAASADTVHVADGAGNSSWAKVDYANLDLSSIKNVNKVYLFADMADVSTAGSAWVVSPLAGTISKIYAVIDAGITGSNTIVTAKIATVAVTNGAVTITQAGSAAGSVFSATPTAANTVTAGQAIELASDGASSTTSLGRFVIEITCS